MCIYIRSHICPQGTLVQEAASSTEQHICFVELVEVEHPGSAFIIFMQNAEQRTWEARQRLSCLSEGSPDYYFSSQVLNLKAFLSPILTLFYRKFQTYKRVETKHS